MNWIVRYIAAHNSDASPGQLNPQALTAYAGSNAMPELAEALRQRYRL